MNKSLNRNLPTVPVNQFSMVPRGDVPRSTFVSTHTYKTTFDADYLIPVYVREVLPGDVYKGNVTMFLRMSTPIFPTMDNIYLDSFFFFVPCRLVWDNWVKFMGEQAAPGDSINYTIPTTPSSSNGFTLGSIADYFGLPIATTPPQVTVALNVSALPFRAYYLIFNEWFRDENLVNPAGFSKGNGPDVIGTYTIPYLRGKRHDYFTSALPWPLKGGINVALPLAGSAAIKTQATDTVGTQTDGLKWKYTGTGVTPNLLFAGVSATGVASTGAAFTGISGQVYPANLYADLSTATGATINSIRVAVATQQLLEKDARGGTRYTELLKNHFGVQPQDARLDRPEYIGGGNLMLNTQAIPQTSATLVTGSTTPIGSLGGTTVGSGGMHFSYAAAEHGYIIGIVNARADLTYQNGVHRMWTRSTRYDFYFPVFAFLGEQIVRNDEIYATGVVATDTAAFGYQERWAEYRYSNSQITRNFRSTITGTLDPWHLSQAFLSAPALNAAFITPATPMQRILAAGALAAGQQFLFDSVWHISCTRAMPARSVPGLVRF